MILSQLRSYIESKRRVTLGELVVHFNVDAEALRGMLQKWQSKGKINKTAANSACGTSCCNCDPLLTEIYEWAETQE